MPSAGPTTNALTADWKGTPNTSYTIAIRRTLDGLYLDFGSDLFSASPTTKYAAFPESPPGSGHFLYTIAGATVPNFTATIPTTPGSAWYPGDLCVEVWDSTQSFYQGPLATAINPNGNDQTYFGTGSGGGDPWATAQPGAYANGTFGYLVAQTFNTLLAAIKAQTDKLAFDPSSNVKAAAVTLPSPAPSGYGGSSGGSGDPFANIVPTTPVAGSWGALFKANVNAPIGSCSTPTTPQTINLAQALTSRKDWTVGGAMNGLWALALGLAKRNRTASPPTLSIFDGGSQTVPLETFTLDDPDNPTTRTPQ